ncbi:MAG: hypothetical protein NUV74_07245 [Candidatus Brocadiaceae bacterium]|nr:hypothetical protein [Candidatus Brocadiaceae bacterium]
MSEKHNPLNRSTERSSDLTPKTQAGSILQIEPKGLNGIRNFEQCTSRENAKCFGSIVDD